MNSRITIRISLIALMIATATSSVPAQWASITGLENAPIICFLAKNDSTFFVGGYMHLFKRSTDRGATWQSVWGNGVMSDTIMALAAKGPYVFVGTYGHAGIYRSTNLGNTWSAAGNGLIYSFNSYQFEVPGDTMFVCSPLGVYASWDLGDYWWPVDNTKLTSSHPRDLAAGNGKLYLATEYQGVFSTPLNTYNWTNIGAPGSYANSVEVLDTSIFVSTATGVFVYSGSGNSWLPRNNGLPSFQYRSNLKVAGKALLLYTGQGGDGIYVSQDLGLTWTPIALAELASTVLSSLVVTDSEVILATSSGAWRISKTSIVTSVGSWEPELHPARVELMPNYPNPFNSRTMIRYRVAESTVPDARVSLAIYDLLGRRVAELVNGSVTPGMHVASWDAGGSPTGVYLCILRSGSSVQTQRLVLIR